MYVCVNCVCMYIEVSSMCLYIIIYNYIYMCKYHTYDMYMYIRGHYQRMEFLGDAILQFLTSIHVYSTFPRHNEGHLTVTIPY